MVHVRNEVNSIKTIVYVTESMASGILTYINELANNLSNNAKIFILYGKRKQTPSNLRKIFKSNINLIEIKHFQRSLNIKNDFKAYLEIKHYLFDINPDIVHLNSSKAGALGRILRFLHFRKFKGNSFFYTPHSYSFLMKDSSKIKRNIYYLIELFLSKLGTTTIACGKGEYETAQKLSENSTYVNNGVNIDYLNNFWSNKSNTKNVVFTIGRINEQKGPKLFNHIAKQFPYKKFVWIGNGPLKNQLTSSNIEITGWLSLDKVLKRIQPYKTFILCSKWEGLSISLLEAMYYKKLCLVTNVIGNIDVISDGYNGLIFNNINEIKDKIINYNLKEDLLNNANKQVIDKYNLNKMLENYIKLYDI